MTLKMGRFAMIKRISFAELENSDVHPCYFIKFRDMREYISLDAVDTFVPVIVRWIEKNCTGEWYCVTLNSFWFSSKEDCSRTHDWICNVILGSNHGEVI